MHSSRQMITINVNVTKPFVIQRQVLVGKKGSSVSITDEILPMVVMRAGVLATVPINFNAIGVYGPKSIEDMTVAVSET